MFLKITIKFVPAAVAAFAVFTLLFAPRCGWCCNTKEICGLVTAAEEANVELQDVLVELRNGFGTRQQGPIKTVATTPGATPYNYHFSNVSDGDYFVDIVPNRRYNANPLQNFVKMTSGAASAAANFSVAGVPAKVTATAISSGTFVLLTPINPWTAALPPTIDQTKTSDQLNAAYSAVVTTAKQAILYVPSLGTGPDRYYITCWVPVQTGQTVTYKKTGSSRISPFKPADQQVNASCPREGA